jgi:HlyD family secretion protein
VARVALQRTLITAPFDGVVSARLVQPGQTVAPSTPLFSLVDRDDIHVRATFDEVDVGRLATGQHARLLLDSFPGRTFEGVLDEISPTVSTSKQENRTVTGKIRFTGDAAGVRPGMSADAEIVVGSSDDALFLPTDVIVQSKGAGGRPSVLVVRGGRVQPQKVETGLSNWDFTEIVSGVSESEQVVSSLDVPGLTPGARVRIAQAPPAEISR